MSPSFLSSNGSSSLKQDGASSTHSQTHPRSIIDGDVPSASNSIALEHEADHERDHDKEDEDRNGSIHQHPSAPTPTSTPPPDSSSNNAKKRTNSGHHHLRPILNFRSMTRKSSGGDGSNKPWSSGRSLSYGDETSTSGREKSNRNASGNNSSNLAEEVGGKGKLGTPPTSTATDEANSSSTPTIKPTNSFKTSNNKAIPHISFDVPSTRTAATTDNGASTGGVRAAETEPPALTTTTTTTTTTSNNSANSNNNYRHNHHPLQSSSSSSAFSSHNTSTSTADNTDETITLGRDLQNTSTLGSIHEGHPATGTGTGTATATHALSSLNPNYNYNADVDDDNDDVHTDQEPYAGAQVEPPTSTAVVATTPLPTTTVSRPPSVHRPPGPPRRQSILPTHQTRLITTLLQSNNDSEIGSTDSRNFIPISGNMVTRKIWVKRPLASATMITINEDDLVDDVRDMILRKYANSLGRQFDSPDITLRICPRDKEPSRVLQPDEPMGRTLDAHYPGGQLVDEALLIDIPSRRTPKASPNPRYYGDDRPHESGTDYFPPYPPAHHTPNSATFNGPHTIHFPPSMAVLGGGQLPALPSPGSVRRMGQGSRPKAQRMHTASPASTVTNGGGHASQTGAPPIILQNYGRPPRSRTHSGASSDHSAATHPPPAAPPMPSPPAPERTATPPPRVSSPRLTNRPKKTKQKAGEERQQQQSQQPQQQTKPQTPSLPSGLLNGAVPPINVLIVEDNPINLRLLEAFVKRLKVRWQTAMNGLEAVSKWRAGGFHLVLMDIQLPKMNGLEATREIRRIEKVNNIGVFSSSASSALSPAEKERAPEPEKEADRLVNTEMFKSPVIIVALTASSLQSDRHEALAAGCNDFLTKVRFLFGVARDCFCFFALGLSPRLSLNSVMTDMIFVYSPSTLSG